MAYASTSFFNTSRRTILYRSRETLAGGGQLRLWTLVLDASTYCAFSAASTVSRQWKYASPLGRLAGDGRNARRARACRGATLRSWCCCDQGPRLIGVTLLLTRQILRSDPRRRAGPHAI